MAVVGAGAAGLMAGIVAARAGARVVILDGARTLGAKILVAGGGRCNVTHHHVDETAFAGSSPAAIRKVLRRFDAAATVDFFSARGVTLKREETGKLFPTTDRARTVLDALLGAARDARAELRHPWRVAEVGTTQGGFALTSDRGEVLEARRVVLATGGRSLPKTGSDGGGYALLRHLGHSITERILPALVPLTLPKGHFLCGLSGLTLPATVEVRSGTGKRLVAFTDSTLFTHFGLSGPSILDVSRYYIHARLDDPGATLVLNLLPSSTAQSGRQGAGEPRLVAGIPDDPARALDTSFQDLGSKTVGRALAERLPARLAESLCEALGVEARTPGHRLSRAARSGLVRAVTALPLPVTGDRGFDYAEVTAGGVPLSEIHLDRMESRRRPDLFLCGEVCDVDGRIGGFNFQWAWASGHVAGRGAARAD